MSDYHDDSDAFMREFRLRNRAGARVYAAEDEMGADEDFIPDIDDADNDTELEPSVQHTPLQKLEIIQLGNLEPDPPMPVGYTKADIIRMKANGEYTAATRLIISEKYREYRRLFYRSMGLNEKRGIPLNLHADDLIRLEQLNRKIRGNRLAGSGPMNTIRIDVFAYVWKNSVILARNNLHVYMLSIHETAYGMGIDESSVVRAFKGMESLGLIKRIGKSMRSHSSYTNCYEIANIDEFFEAHGLLIRPNFQIRDRVSDIIIGSTREFLKGEKEDRPQKPKKNSNKKKEPAPEKKRAVIDNPLWGLFEDVID